MNKELVDGLCFYHTAIGLLARTVDRFENKTEHSLHSLVVHDANTGEDHTVALILCSIYSFKVNLFNLSDSQLNRLVVSMCLSWLVGCFELSSK